MVADMLGVTLPAPYHWVKAWKAKGLVGWLAVHQGGVPAKLTAELLGTAEAIARDAPCPLAQIKQVLRERHPDAPPFISLDCLANGLKKRGLSFKRTLLSLKKNAASTSSRPHRPPSNVARTQPGRAS